MPEPLLQRKIGLVLSGGGLRALLFHLGVVKWLAERGLMSAVSEISSVSGGSWCLGCILGHAKGNWPSDQSYLLDILPRIKVTLTERSMLKALVCAALRRPWLLTRRFQLFVRVFKSHWGLDLALDALPSRPNVHINATTFETGKRWSFSRRTMGDYVFGYSDKPSVPVALAVAASSGFPLFVGPVTLDTRDYEWRDGPYSRGSSEKVRFVHPVLHLWDGGVYENTGLEPLFKSGELRHGLDFLVVADAAEPFALAQRGWWLTRALRLLLIAMDQVRSLRARQVVGAFDKAKNGFYAKIGKSPRQLLDDLGHKGEPWFEGPLTSEQCQRIATFTIYPRKVLPIEFDTLVTHGWQTCETIFGAIYEQTLTVRSEYINDPVGKSTPE